MLLKLLLSKEIPKNYILVEMNIVITEEMEVYNSLHLLYLKIKLLNDKRLNCQKIGNQKETKNLMIHNLMNLFLGANQKFIFLEENKKFNPRGFM